jgi:DNA-directed RNA polymerase subunit RPC12/RpoP
LILDTLQGGYQCDRCGRDFDQEEFDQLEEVEDWNTCSTCGHELSPDGPGCAQDPNCDCDSCLNGEGPDFEEGCYDCGAPLNGKVSGYCDNCLNGG